MAYYNGQQTKQTTGNICTHCMIASNALRDNLLPSPYTKLKKTNLRNLGNKSKRSAKPKIRSLIVH